MKKWIIIIIVLAALFFAFKAVTKVRAAAVSLVPEFDSVKRTGGDIFSFMAGSAMPIAVKLKLKNFSDQVFTVENFKVELQTMDGKTIASQTAILKSPLVVQKRSSPFITIPFNVDKVGLIALIRSGNFDHAPLEKLKDYFIEGKLGVKAKLVGWAQLFGQQLPLNIVLDL